MRSYGYKSTEEHPAPALSRHEEKDAARPKVSHELPPAGTFAHRQLSDGLTKWDRSIAKRLMLQLQQNCGNQWVQQALELSKKPDDQAEVAPDLERSIETARGTGHSLDSTTGRQLGTAMNAEFSGVRVHTDTRADSLNRALNAKAFTTGRDIFFRQGEYNPGSSSGRELLAHELTHVIQQGEGNVQAKDEDEAATSSCPFRNPGLGRSIQAKLTVGSPKDIYEEEADRMARTYTQLEQRGPRPVEGVGSMHRQAVDEENKEEQKPVMAQLKKARVLCRNGE
jgi:hypothetical protein